MKTDGAIFLSEAQRSARASELTGGELADTEKKYTDLETWRRPGERRPKTDGRATDVEIAHLEKMGRDLATGLANLRNLRPAPKDFNQRILAQAAKLRSVEAKLFRLRQGRLL